MTSNNWRKKVDPSIKSHLEFQIKESARNVAAIKSSKNPSNAQLWCAIANLSKQIFDVNLRLRYLERAVRDLARVKESTMVFKSRSKLDGVPKPVKTKSKTKTKKRKVTKKNTKSKKK
jgi:hypothetical protein